MKKTPLTVKLLTLALTLLGFGSCASSHHSSSKTDSKTDEKTQPQIIQRERDLNTIRVLYGTAGYYRRTTTIVPDSVTKKKISEQKADKDTKE